jgi:hypothetical protein
MQRVTQPSATHARRTGVEQRKQRRCRLTPYGFGDLEIAARRRIHANVSARVLDRQRLDMRYCRALCRPRVFQQGTGGCDRDRVIGRAETRQIERLELAAQRTASRVAVEVPCGHLFDRSVER